MKSGTCPTPYARIHTLLCSPCSLNFPNLCDNFVKILVFEIRKFHQLQRDEVPLTRALPLDPIGASAPKPLITQFGLPLAEGLDSPLTEMSSYTQLERNVF